MLRDAQIIGCADMPQYADMPLLPLRVYVYTVDSDEALTITFLGNDIYIIE